MCADSHVFYTERAQIHLETLRRLTDTSLAGAIQCRDTGRERKYPASRYTQGTSHRDRDRRK